MNAAESPPRSAEGEVKGRTVSKMLTPQQLETYQPWLDNGRRLRELAHKLETLSIEAMRTAEGWNARSG